MFNILFKTLAITDTISDFVEPYIQQALDLLTGFDVWIQGLILLGLGVFTLVGVIVFIKKFIKLFLVLAILGGIAYVLYSQGILDGILDSFSAFITSTFMGW